MSEEHSPTEIVAALLELRSWTAFDIDDEGRVLAGHDELGSMQLVEIAPDGSRTPLTNLPGRCTGRYLPGSRRVIVQHDQGGDEMWQISLLDIDSATLPASLDELEPLVADPGFMHIALHADEGSIIYSTNRRNGVDMDVISRELASGAERTLVEASGMVSSLEPSHDRRSVALATLSRQPSSTAVAVVGGDGRRELTSHDEHANHRVAGWSSDDGSLILSSNHDRDFFAISRLGLDGSWRLLVEADHDVHAWPSRDSGVMVVQHHADGLDRLAIHAEDGTHLVDVALEPAVLRTLVWSGDGSRFVVDICSPTDPGSILQVDAATGVARVVVDGRETLPEWLRDRLVTPTVHRIPAPDGEQIPCFRYASPGSPRLAPGASVVHIHGGPESEAARIFSPMLQALTLSGFDVLVPNVRGSAGYGKRWVSLDDVERRLDSVADLAAIHAWLPQADLDQQRSALWGGSYGGYMVLCGVSIQPGLWAAGVDIVGMSSLVTFLENTSVWRRAYREREYGSLERDRAMLQVASPITHLGAITAPLFVIHGANDPRVPLSEAEQIAESLAGKGIPCELRVYHDEGHGLSKRVNRLDAYPAAIDFLVEQLG